MSESTFLKAPEIASIMEVSIPYAYKIIRNLNNELQQQGYLTVHGKVSRKFFESRYYSGQTKSTEV